MLGGALHRIPAAVCTQKWESFYQTKKLGKWVMNPHGVIEGPSTILTFLGIELDSTALQARLPEDKLTDLMTVLDRKKVLFVCDNLADVACIRSGTSHSQVIMALLQNLLLLAAKSNFTVSARYLAGVKIVSLIVYLVSICRNSGDWPQLPAQCLPISPHHCP